LYGKAATCFFAPKVLLLVDLAAGDKGLASFNFTKFLYKRSLVFKNSVEAAFG